MAPLRSRCLSALILSICIAVAWAASGSATTARAEEDSAVALANAQAFSPGLRIPDAARPGPDFDVDRATRAYIALLSPEQRARSDAYFEGRYWLGLWQSLYLMAAALLILQLGAARRMRERAARMSTRPALQSMYFAVMFLALIWVLQLPMAWYADFHREHQYGLSTQTLAGWFRDEFVNALFLIALGTIVVVALYAFVRRARNAWIPWAAAFVFVFFLFVSLIAPVFIAPAFNDYRPLPPGELREEILSLARANEIPADDVMWYDASRQTRRISANVSGFFGTMQISLNDNLLHDTSVPEIRAVMAHEMGHYVLNHVLRHAVYLTLVFTIGMALVRRVVDRIATSRRGGSWGITGTTDLAALPLVFAVFLGFLTLASPVVNRIVYAGEVEADLFGLNAAREAHGFATVAMRLAANRKLDPSPLEKLLFYDHPSGRDRVEMAMQWLRENPTHVPISNDAGAVE